MKSMTGALPWLVVLAVVGGVLWWMLSKDMPAGRWIFAVLLLAHGLVHLMYVVPAPGGDGATWPFDMTRSWLGAGSGALRTVGLVLIILTIAGFLLAALSTVGILVPTGWWQAAVVFGSTASAVTLIVFFDPQLVLGLVIDALLVWIAATRLWSP